MKRDLEFLYEVGCLRRQQRSWSQFLFPDAASNTDHTFRVIWTALALARRENLPNTEKVLKMALVHDLPESRTGDTNYLSRQYVSENNSQAIADIFAETILEEEFTALLKEYEQRESMEAKIVKDADNLDVDMELAEAMAMGNPLLEKFQEHRKLVYDMFYTESAKELWTEIQSADPHAWHLNGRNRFNGGDWKEFKDKRP
jgi:putative hydrolase of HD superfamily